MNHSWKICLNHGDSNHKKKETVTRTRGYFLVGQSWLPSARKYYHLQYILLAMIIVLCFNVLCRTPAPTHSLVHLRQVCKRTQYCQLPNKDWWNCTLPPMTLLSTCKLEQLWGNLLAIYFLSNPRNSTILVLISSTLKGIYEEAVPTQLVTYSMMMRLD